MLLVFVPHQLTQAHCLGCSKLFKVRATLQRLFSVSLEDFLVVVFFFLSSVISVKKQLKKNLCSFFKLIEDQSSVGICGMPY